MDERTRHLRRLRRLRGSVRRWSVFAGGVTATTAVVVPYLGIGALDAIWAGLSGAALMMTWWRWRDLRALAAQPLPEPTDPAVAGDRLLSMIGQLPGGYPVAEVIRRQRTRVALRGSTAADLFDRLDRSARSMRELTARLGGVAAIDREALTEAATVERELRELTNRITGLERAIRLAPAEASPALQELRDDHVRQLEQGVAAYEQFVVAAAGYLSESARTGVPPATVEGLTSATERLRGVTAGLTELRSLYGDLRTPPEPRPTGIGPD